MVRAIRANFVPVKKAEHNFEIAARTLCLRVYGATPRFTAAVKIPLPRQHFSSRILFDRKLSESYFFLLWIKQREKRSLRNEKLKANRAS